MPHLPTHRLMDERVAPGKARVILLYLTVFRAQALTILCCYRRGSERFLSCPRQARAQEAYEQLPL
jgi:hypothetical protein